MTLERIESHIMDEARSRASQIEAQGKAQAEHILKTGRERIDKRTDDALARLQAELAAEADKQIAILRARHGMQLLEQKTRIIDHVFQKAADKLLFNERYWSRLREELKKLAGHEGTIRCRAEHKETLAKMRDELNRETGGKMPPLGEPIAITGGFILEGKSFDVDHSLDAELARFREKVLPELIAKAFAEK